MVHRTVNGALLVIHMLHNNQQGVKECRCGGIFVTTPCRTRIIKNIASHQGSQGTETSTENTVPEKPFTIVDRQLHAIYILAALFNTMPPEKTKQECYLGKC